MCVRLSVPVFYYCPVSLHLSPDSEDYSGSGSDGGSEEEDDDYDSEETGEEESEDSE